MLITKTPFTLVVFTFTFSMLFICTSCGVSYSSPTLTPTRIPTAIDDPNLIDTSWLNDEPCRAPCWYGLNLWQSTLNESLDLVRTLPFIQPSDGQFSFKQYYDGVQVEELIYFECKEPSGTNCVLLGFVDSTLIEVFLFPNFYITFEDVVTSIGAPDFIGAGPIDPAADECQVNLIWMERQMSISYSESKKATGRDLCQIIQDASNKVPTDLVVFTVNYGLRQRNQIPVEKRDHLWSGFIQP